MPERIDHEQVLMRLFPPELRADKFGASAASDVWAGSDVNFLTEFGIEVRPPVEGKTLFTASSVASL